MGARFDPQRKVWDFDTIEEAVEFYRRADDGVAAKQTSKPLPKRKIVWRPAEPPPTLDDKSRILLQHLAKSPEGIPGRELAKALGLEHGHLGAVVSRVIQWGKSVGLDRDHMIVKMRSRERGKAIRSLKLAPELLRRIRERKIDGVS